MIEDKVNLTLVEKNRENSLDIDWSIGPSNIHDVEYGDYFQFWYYGIIVIFRVNYTSLNKVSVYEILLEDVKYEDNLYQRITKNIRKGKKQGTTLVVPYNMKNNDRDTRFWCYTGLGQVLIPVEKYSPLYNLACRNGAKNPDVGVFVATKVNYDHERMNSLREIYWAHDEWKFKDEEIGEA